MKLPSIFKVWDNEYKIWRKSGNGLQMWSKRGIAEGVKNRWHSPYSLEIKEFYLLPKEDLYTDTIADHTGNVQYFDIKRRVFLEEFGSDAHQELSSVIPDYDASKASLIAITHIGDAKTRIDYVFRYEDDVYYRFSTVVLQNGLGRRLAPGYHGFVEPKFIVSYMFVTKG